nr:hypothetical protein [Prevotella sp.]
MKKFVFAAIAAIVMVSVSNVFASNKMMSNAQVAPVDTVAPATPTDSSAVSTPVTPQAGAEDSTEQQNQEVVTPTETNPTEATEVQASSEQQAVAE